MAIYDMGLPDGRTLTLEAPDDQSAVNAATEWHAANPIPNTATDVAKSTVSGLGKGVTNILGMPGDIGSLVSKGAEALGVPENIRRGVGAQLSLNPYMRPFVQGPTSQDVQTAAESVTGKFYDPQTTAGKYARTVGEFAPGAALPGGWARRLVGNVLAPAIGSEAAGQATEGSAAEPYARLGGAIAGGMVPGALARVATPFPASAARTEAVNTLRNEGVDSLTAGQATGRKGLQAIESELGGGRGANLMERQAEQFTSAALRRIGETANRATPEVLDRAYNRIGNQFETVANRNTLNVDRRFANDFAQVQQDYNFLANPLQKQVVQSAVDDIIGVIQQNNGTIPGAQYQAMRSRLGQAARGTSDNQLREAFYGLQRSLDDAMERSIAATGNRADAAAWREARTQYRNFLVIEKAATSAGENSAMGLISPASLRNATVNVQGRRNYATGNGDFEALSRAGVAALSPLPNSGTPIRTGARNLGMSPTGATAGTAIGGWLTGGNPVGMATGALIGGYTPPAIGRAVVSTPGRAFLGNQLLADYLNNAPPMLQQALINSILSNQQRPLLSPPSGR